MKNLLFLLIIPFSFFSLYTKNDHSSAKKNFSNPFSSTSSPTEFETLLNQKPIIDTKQAYYELKAAEQRSAAKKYGAVSLGGLLGGSLLHFLGQSQQMPVLEAGGMVIALVGAVGALVTGFKFFASVYNDRNTPDPKKENNTTSSPDTLLPEKEPVPSSKN